MGFDATGPVNGKKRQRNLDWGQPGALANTGVSQDLEKIKAWRLDGCVIQDKALNLSEPLV